MAVALRATASSNSGASSPNTIVINKPAGTVSGDVMLANLGANLGTTQSFTSSGWAQLPNWVAQSQGSTTLQQVLYKVAGGSEPSNYTFTLSNSSVAHNVGNIASYSGVDNNNPFAGYKESTSTASTSVVWPQPIPQCENAYPVLLGIASGTSTITVTASTGFNVSSQDVSTVTRFECGFIMDGASTVGLPIAAYSPPNGSLSNSSTQTKTALFLRPDLSASSGLTVDVVTAGVNASATAHTFPLTTGYAEAIVVMMSSSAIVAASSVSGASLTWTQIGYQNASGSRSVEAWYAYSASAINNQTITISYATSSPINYEFITFMNASATPLGANSIGTGITQSITTTANNSMVVYGITMSAWAAVTAATSNTSTQASLFNSGAAGSAFGRSTAVVSSSGTSFAAGLSAPGGKTYDTVAFEVLAAVTNATVTQVAANVTASDGGGTTVTTAVSAAITQVAANITTTGGTQALATSNFVTIAQVASNVTATGGTQAVAAGSVINASVTQVAGTVTASGGTQTVATVNNVAVAQTAATVTAGGGTQTIATVNKVSIVQAAATVTATGGTQTVATVRIVAIAQVAATITATGGTQVVASSNFVALSQLAATLTVNGGTQTVSAGTVISAAITQVAATLTATGGTQAIQSSRIASVTQVAATLTATGGTQTVASVGNVSIAQLAANLTTTGGTQVVSAVIIASSSITQVAANLTTTGGLQAILAGNNISIAQLAANLTATGGTQTLASQIAIAIAQQAANLTVTGGTQTADLGVVNISIAQLAASLLATGGTQTVLIPAVYTPIAVAIFSGNHSFVDSSGNKVTEASSGVKLDSVSTGTKTKDVSTSDNDTNIISSNTRMRT